MSVPEVEERYNEDKTPTAENVSEYKKNETVEIAVAGKIIVGKIINIREFESSLYSDDARMRIEIDKNESVVPEDDRLRELNWDMLVLVSGTMRGESSKTDKLSASVPNPVEHRTSHLLGVVGSIRKE